MRCNESATLSVIIMLLARLRVLNLMLNHARNVAQMRAAKSPLDKLHHRQEIERETTNPKRRLSRESVFASCVDRDTKIRFR